MNIGPAARAGVVRSTGHGTRGTWHGHKGTSGRMEAHCQGARRYITPANQDDGSRENNEKASLSRSRFLFATTWPSANLESQGAEGCDPFTRDRMRNITIHFHGYQKCALCAVEIVSGKATARTRFAIRNAVRARRCI